MGSSPRIVDLGPDDIDRLVELERSTFDPSIQASRETILQRLSLGHFLIGVEDEGRLAGAVAFSYARFDPADRASFPRTETELTLQAVPHDFNAVFIYSRGVRAAYQSRGYSKLLVHAAMVRARRAGCRYVIGNPRTPAYAGNYSSFESIPQNARFKAAIDRHLAGGPFPSLEELLEDPSMQYYAHFPGRVFHWLLPNFAPHDTASGGIRLIVYARLE